jgi:hypothetical protein
LSWAGTGRCARRRGVRHDRQPGQRDHEAQLHPVPLIRTAPHQRHSGRSSKPTPERKTHVTRGGKTHVVHPRGSRGSDSLGGLRPCMVMQSATVRVSRGQGQSGRPSDWGIGSPRPTGVCKGSSCGTIRVALNSAVTCSAERWLTATGALVVHIVLYLLDGSSKGFAHGLHRTR